MLEVFFNKSAECSRQMSQNNKNSETVVSLDCHLDIGDISKGMNSSGRAEVFRKLFDRADLTTQQKNLEKIITAAKAGKVIRVWKSTAPFSKCGFVHICNQLRAIDCTIRVIHLPNHIVGSDETIISYHHWGEVSPDKFESFLAFEKKLTEVEKEMYSNQWQDLKAENSPLRAIINGELLSVPADFYDHLIVKNLSDHAFVMEEVVAHLIGKYPIAVSNAWYEYRIRLLVEASKTLREQTRKSQNFHQVK